MPTATTSLTQRVLGHLARMDEEGAAARVPDLDVFRSKARWICRSISPWIDLEAVFDVAIRLLLVTLNTTTPSWQFPALIKALADNRDEYNVFLAMMTKAMREARSQDTNLIKTNINKVLAVDPDNSPFSPAIPEAKALRGWKHVETGRALAPFKHKARFSEHPTKYRTRAEAGKIKPRLSDLPSFLYPSDAVYHRQRRDDGLFRGHAVIRALRGIYTGESSIVKGHRNSRRLGQGEKHGMRLVTPQAVAYAATQVYVNSTSLETWGGKWGYFDIEGFYNACVEMFTKKPNNPWAIETLKFLTSQVPSLNRDHNSKGGLLEDPDAEPIDPEDPTGILSMWEERDNETDIPANRDEDPEEDDDLHLCDDSETEQDSHEPARPDRAVSAPSTQNPPVRQPVPAPHPAPSAPSPHRLPVASSSALPQPQPPAPRRSRSPTRALSQTPSPQLVPQKRRLLRQRTSATVEPEDNDEEPEAPSAPAKRSKAAKTPRQTRNKKKTA
ncbi:hypothetical protein D9613_004495 [Agrocybe pediades]|uniref:Uncharacterized protein n=1 Tax=Agrocybe pediades TaxID=84607 RepID=A0A8H4VKU3_9AGAR|nr:hypothetical protein D9613_004495 [Agrocybe pediades]